MNQYQQQAMRTAKMLPHRDNLIHFALGLTGEAGELADAIKKHVVYGRELDKINVIEELGDILWMVALACETLDVPMQDVADANIGKLRARYPQGFSAKDELHRDINAEIVGMGI